MKVKPVLSSVIQQMEKWKFLPCLWEILLLTAVPMAIDLLDHLLAHVSLVKYGLDQNPTVLVSLQKMFN